MEGEAVCGDGFGTMPSVRWLYDFAEIKRRASLDLWVDNPYATPIAVNLTLASHGLDQRVVKRALGSMQVAAGSNGTFAVDLTLLPIQGVSYSSLGIVELAVDRGPDTIHVTSRPFHYHFLPTFTSYGNPYVYSFDTMMAQLDGGLGAGAFDLRGRVWKGSSWVAVAVLRDEEGLPSSWSGTPFRFDPGPPQPPDTPPATGNLEICFEWRTKFIDAGYGEDFATTVSDQVVRAAHTYAELARVISTPCDAFASGDPCLDVKFQGYLDENGCVIMASAVQGADYFAFVHSYFRRERPGQFNDFTADVRYVDPLTDTSQGFVSWRVQFQPSTVQSPPWNIIAPVPFLTTANTNATLSRQLAQPDLPAIDGGIHHFAPRIHVWAHKRDTGQPGYEDGAVAYGENVYTGDWLRWDNDAPGGLQSKMILAHEYGHVHHHNGSNSLTKDYGADQPSETLCTCDEVEPASNRRHCLQSREEIGAAQLEGLAQFYAAKTWNDPTQSNCWWAYYKNFATGFFGQVLDPPLSRDCYNPPKWRNTRCFQATRGTEYDWQLFYWNINNRGTATTLTSDLWQIYQGVCGGGCSQFGPVTWPALKNAAESYFAAQPLHAAHFVSWGANAGVDETQ